MGTDDQPLMRNQTGTPYDHHIFLEHTKPIGLLPYDLGAQACWYYFGIAHRVYGIAGSTDDQIVIQDEESSVKTPWRVKRYWEQKQGIAKQYGVTPETMDKYWGDVKAEAIRCRILGNFIPDPLDEYVKAGPGKESYHDQ